MDRRTDRSLLQRITADRKSRTLVALLSAGILADRAASIVQASTPSIGSEIAQTKKTAKLDSNQSHNLVLNSFDCVPSFYIPRGTTVSSTLRITVDREYLEVDKNGNVLRDITDELPSLNRSFNELDEQGNVFAEINGLSASFTDYQTELLDDKSQRSIFRARYGTNQTLTQTYQLYQQTHPDGRKTWEKGDEEWEVKAVPINNDLIEVSDRCGNRTLRRALTVELKRMLKNGVLKPFVDASRGIKRLAEDCVYKDHITTTHRITAKVEAPVEVPREEVKPPPVIQPPVQVPVQIPRPAPVQIPKY